MKNKERILILEDRLKNLTKAFAGASSMHAKGLDDLSNKIEDIKDSKATVHWGEQLEKQIESLREEIKIHEYSFRALNFALQSLEEKIKTLESMPPNTSDNWFNPPYEVTCSPTTIVGDGIDTSTNTIKATDLTSISIDAESVKAQVTKLLKQSDLPDMAVWVAVDANTKTWVYSSNKPTFSASSSSIWKNNKSARPLGYVDLNGVDWKQCCWKISDLLATQDQPNLEDLSAIKTMQGYPNQAPTSDWENLLSVDDIKIIFPVNMDGDKDRYLINYLNRLIYQQLKPLLDEVANYKESHDALLSSNKHLQNRIAELESKSKVSKRNYDVCKRERDNYYDELHEKRKLIAELKGAFKSLESISDIEFAKVFGKKRESVSENLNEALKRISELEALNKTLESRIPNRLVTKSEEK
jgi:cell division septum initiation protein DivIVA